MKLVREVSYGLCLLQLKQGDIRFLYGDEKFAEITGYEPEEVVSADFSVKNIIPDKSRKEFVFAICKQMKERSTACIEMELIRKDGKSINTVCCMSRYFDQDYKEECIKTVIQDVTEERQAHIEMMSRLEQDAMTGVYNKNAIERVINGALELESDKEHALYLIDIDNFKQINDTFGHVFGDTVIQDFVTSVRKAFSKRAVLGRIGGDEFVVFLPDTNQEEVQEAAKRVTNAIRREITTELDVVQISGSVGIVMWQPGEDYQTLVKKADAAMYHSKDRGKNQNTFFEEFMMEEFQKKQYHTESVVQKKIKEHAYDVDFVFFAYQLLTDSKQFDSSMNLLMDRTVERFGLDRASVFEYQKTEPYFQRTNTGVATSARRLGESECYMEKKWLEKHVDSWGQVVVNEIIPGINAPAFNNYMAIPRSFVICDIKEKGDTCGCVIFSQYQKKRAWTEYEIETFRELAKAIAVFVSLRKDKRDNMEEIYRLNTRDKVTGLLDQKNFEIKLENYIRHCKEFKCLALVYVDINNFSYVNERYGVSAGNQVLSTFGKLLLRDENTLLAGRMFSDCFLGLHLDESKERAVAQIAEAHETMLDILRKKYPIASLQFKCGIYFLEDEKCSVHEAIENANMARKSIKEDGRMNCRVYEPRLRHSRSREQEIIAEFQECIESDALELYLQPSFVLSTKKLKGAEAFCRWHNAMGVERRPEEIVPVLKKNGYILEWDMAVYEKVLQMMRQWKQKGKELPNIEINFSTMDFQCAGIVEDIVALAKKYEVNTDQLVIEMSEHGLRRAPEKVIYVLKELRKHGFKIAIDNFGSNYSSLEMLVDESIDVIKTGRNLLHMGKEEELRSDYLRYIRGVVKSSSKEIIFVGAESKQQEKELKSCGYDIVQGYLYERELPADLFAEQYV